MRMVRSPAIRIPASPGAAEPVALSPAVCNDRNALWPGRCFRLWHAVGMCQRVLALAAHPGAVNRQPGSTLTPCHADASWLYWRSAPLLSDCPEIRSRHDSAGRAVGLSVVQRSRPEFRVADAWRLKAPQKSGPCSLNWHLPVLTVPPPATSQACAVLPDRFRASAFLRSVIYYFAR